MPALGRLEVPKAVLLRQGVEKPENGRDHVLQCLVQGEQVPGGLGANGASVITLVDTEIRLQKIGDREIAGDLAIGDRAGLEGPTTGETVGVRQLVEEAGLAHACFAHDSHDLAVAALRPFERCAELLHLGIASDESAQASEGGGLKSCSHFARSDHLEHLDRGHRGPVSARDRGAGPGRSSRPGGGFRR
jgi:hypothetical protein